MKKLKFMLMSFVMVISLLGTGQTSSASTYSTGKAILPIYYTDGATHTSFAMSNITDSPINVTITFYNDNGTLMTDDNKVDTGKITGSTLLLNYCDQNLDSTVTFTLAAHVTGYIALNSSIPNIGYGVIQWSQNSNALLGLVVFGSYSHTATGQWSTYGIPVNGGLPF